MKTGMINTITGHNIRRLRTMHRYTQEELANRIKAKTSHISEMENGKRGIGEKIIVRLCNVFNVEPYELYVNNKSPVPLTPLQYKALHLIKEAEELKSGNIVDEAFEFAQYRIKTLKKASKTKSSSRRGKSKKARSS